MTKRQQNHFHLSNKMKKLKEEIQNQTSQSESLLHKVHKSSSFASTVLSGINNVFGLIAGFLSAYKEVPVVGGILQLIAMVPKSIAIMTDPEKSKQEKIITASLIAVLLGLAITAFVLGSVAALIIGVVIASIVTVLEGAGFIGQAVAKYQTHNALKTKLEFNLFLEHRIAPEGNTHDELFEIRAVELLHELEKPNLQKKDQIRFTEELSFINEVLKKKDIIPGSNKDNPAFKLQELYNTRKEQLSELVQKIALKDTAVDESDLQKHLDAIQVLQKKLIKTDDDIENITRPIEKLTDDNAKANEKLAFSYATFALAGAGTIFSVIGLLLVVGSVAAPPFVLPLLVGFGVGMAAISLLKWTAEKIAQYEDKKIQTQKSQLHEELILDEALNGYDRQINPEQSLTGESSHSVHMQKLLTSKAPEQKETYPETPVKPAYSPLFTSSSSESIEPGIKETPTPEPWK